ncbi:MAG: alpha/beta fold hydrolase [Flavobacteriales bacterium]
MNIELKQEGKYNFLDLGEGKPIVLLHGLMGALSNFQSLTHFLVERGYRVLMPVLPIYDLPLLKTSAKSIAKFLYDFVDYKNLKDLTLIGNSLGGHVGLIFSKEHPDLVKRLVLTGSSGLYENAMGGSFPRREDYNYIKTKTEEVFYDKSIATKELVDECYETLNSRAKVLKVLAIAKSAIRHNMAKDLPNMHQATCLIWGKNDIVTPPHVANEFHKLLPNSDLFWIDKCGHAPMMEHPDTFNDLVYNWLKANE